MKNIFILLALVFATTISSYAQSKSKKSKPKTQSASLKGSRLSQWRQNHNADKNDLSRLKGDKQLYSMIKNKYLVPVTTWVHLDARMKRKFCVVRPWVNTFLKAMTYEFHRDCKTKRKFIVTSATRTIHYQLHLQGSNGNAAGVTGPYATSHTTGSTIDITKRNLTPSQIAWVRKYLTTKETYKRVEATEECVQSCFHIMAYKEAWTPLKKKKINPTYKFIYPKNPKIQGLDTFTKRN